MHHSTSLITCKHPLVDVKLNVLTDSTILMTHLSFKSTHIQHNFFKTNYTFIAASFGRKELAQICFEKMDRMLQMIKKAFPCIKFSTPFLSNRMYLYHGNSYLHCM